MKYASITVFLFLNLALSSYGQTSSDVGQSRWIVTSIREIKTIKVGMTRATLLKIFTTEGGLSTGLNRTFVYRDCPYIKVDVEFEPVGRAARDADGRVTLAEDNRDLIKSISKPYLELSIID